MSTYSSTFEKIFNEARAEREQFEAKVREKENVRAQEHRRDERIRDSFLDAIQAVPLPVELYALWLGIHLQNGGSLSWSSKHNFVDDRSLVATGAIGDSENPLTFTPSSVPEWLLATAWPKAPTTSLDAEPKGIPIPAGYGALSIKLMVLPDLLPNVNLKPASYGRYGTGRQGCEWGHTKVFRLNKSSTPGEFDAWTNKPDHVYSYPDVEALILQYEPAELAARAQRALPAPIIPETKQID